MNYNDMSLAELKALAKEKGIKGISALKKAELVELLNNSIAAAKKAPAEEAVAKEVKPAVKEEAVEAKASVEAAEIAPKPVENNSSTTVERTPERRVYSNAGMVRPRMQQERNARPQQARPQSYGRDNQTTRSFVPRDNQAPRGNANRDNQPARPQYVITHEGQDTREQSEAKPVDMSVYDTGIEREGIFEQIKNENYGFIRCDNFLPGEDDVYISPAQIRRFGLKTGDFIKGNLKQKTANEKFQGLVSIKSVNGISPEEIVKRPRFEDLTPIFPHERIHLETPKCSPAMRLVDLISPVGKGQRGMIVSQPKAGKTTLLKQIANAITTNHPEMKIIILLIDERPEEVTDIKESIVSNNVEVIYSTFDELPDNHKRVSEMVIERAKRLVESKHDVCILLDSITRLSRAYNLTVVNSGRTLSGGLDPAALYMPKKFFGAARCMREGGSLTILSTALVDTGSRMDDVVFEEFKGTGNMELVLDRSLSERRVFPAIDLKKSGTRREDLLLTPEENEAVYLMRTQLNGARSEDAIETILNNVRRTKNNAELVELIRGVGIFGK